MSGQRGSVLVEFALVWPLVLLTTLASVQVALWGSAAFAARAAALAGARVGAAAGGSPAAAFAAAEPVLRAVMPQTGISAWCPGQPLRPRGVWVCAGSRPSGFEVEVGGALPGLLPLVAGAGGPGVHADAVLPYERFQ